MLSLCVSRCPLQKGGGYITNAILHLRLCSRAERRLQRASWPREPHSALSRRTLFASSNGLLVKRAEESLDSVDELFKVGFSNRPVGGTQRIAPKHRRSPKQLPAWPGLQVHARRRRRSSFNVRLAELGIEGGVAYAVPLLLCDVQQRIGHLRCSTARSLVQMNRGGWTISAVPPLGSAFKRPPGTYRCSICVP